MLASNSCTAKTASLMPELPPGRVSSRLTARTSDGGKGLPLSSLMSLKSARDLRLGSLSQPGAENMLLSLLSWEGAVESNLLWGCWLLPLPSLGPGSLRLRHACKDRHNITANKITLRMLHLHTYALRWRQSMYTLVRPKLQKKAVCLHTASSCYPVGQK